MSDRAFKKPPASLKTRRVGDMKPRKPGTIGSEKLISILGRIYPEDMVGGLMKKMTELNNPERDGEE